LDEFSLSGLTRKNQKRQFVSPSRLVLFLGALLIVGLWLYVNYQIEHDYDRTIVEASQETLNLTKAFEEHVRRVLADADHDLCTLKLIYEWQPPSRSALAAYSMITPEDPSRSTVAVYNEQGIVVDSFTPNALGQNRSDREYFQVHREFTSQKLYIGKPIIDRIEGIAVIPLTRRINKLDGTFGGIVYVGLRADYFLEFYKKIDLGQNQLISLSGTDGFNRARRVGDNVATGQDNRGSVFWENVQTGRPYASFVATNVLDGVSRITSYRIMPDYPLIVAVGKSTQVALTHYEQRKQGYIGGASLVSVIIFIFGGLLVSTNEKNKKLAMGVQRERDRLSSLINSISDEVWFADINKKITLANPSAVQEFLLDADTTDIEELAKSLEVLRPDGTSRPIEESPPLRALQGEIVKNQQEIVRTPANGAFRHREVNAGPVRDGDGKIIGAVSVVRDITERKQAEKDLAELCEKLEEASHAKSRFLANMSHELRTPLNAIIGFSEVLKDKLFGPLNTRQDKYVENVLVSAQYLLSLVNDVLDMSKAEAGKMELEKSRIDINEICRDSIAFFRDKATKRRVYLSFIPEAAMDDVTVFADGRRIKQILYNLIDNGIKYNKPNGSLSVTVKKINGGSQQPVLQIVVEDTGIGISNDNLAQLFKPFGQLFRTHTELTEGTGLGLALAKHLVELHNGEIHVESEFGKGSRFIVLIPMQKEQA